MTVTQLIFWLEDLKASVGDIDIKSVEERQLEVGLRLVVETKDDIIISDQLPQPVLLQ